MSKFDLSMNEEGYLMKVGPVNVGLNMPTALKSVGEGKEEHAHGLPPYHRRRAYLVDEYPACPKDWLRSSGRIKSYFVPIIENNGLWLDLNGCLSTSPSHVAVVVSAQGVNAITGLPCKDAQLEQYRDECPKHKKAFGPDRLCEDCGFKWPKQNYLCTTGQPAGQFWLDGFRAVDGFIRQYIFTAQKMRGVANAIIGEDRVFALGLSYFLSKEPRPAPPVVSIRSDCSKGGNWGSTLHFMSASAPDMELYDSTIANNANDTLGWGKEASASYTCSVGGPKGMLGTDGPKGPPGAPKVRARKLMSFSGDEGMKREYTGNNAFLACAASAPMAPTINYVETKKLEIAAGARIAQHIHDDPNGLDFWQTEPEGLIVVNYCLEEDAERIIAAGKIDLSGHPDGFLAKVPVGNP